MCGKIFISSTLHSPAKQNYLQKLASILQNEFSLEFILTKAGSERQHYYKAKSTDIRLFHYSVDDNDKENNKTQDYFIIQ